ncbi:MAG TPA: dihydropteroate synthase [Thermotogota bacterium]|nr:dihydropteroate synthase [Thermotogota bacterium]
MLFKRFLCSDFRENAERFFVTEDTYALCAYRLSQQERCLLLDICLPYLTALNLSEIRIPMNGMPNEGFLFLGERPRWEQTIWKLLRSRSDLTIVVLTQILELLYNRNLRPITLPSGKQLSFERPLFMGVINRTTDSFYAQSRIESDQEALEKALEMEEQGAQLIDVGGESSRPGSLGIPEQEEEERVIPAIRLLAKHIKIRLSVDTTKASIAKKAIDAGADIVNDISGLSPDSELFEYVANQKIPAVIMHIQGTPKTMQTRPTYRHVVREVQGRFELVLNALGERGYPLHQAILDPGFGFGKTLPDHLYLWSELASFLRFRLPVLVGTSRKSFLGATTGTSTPAERLPETLATTASGIARSVNIFRVHDVKENFQVAKMAFFMMGFVCEGVNERGVHSETR